MLSGVHRPTAPAGTGLTDGAKHLVWIDWLQKQILRPLVDGLRMTATTLCIFVP